MAKNGHRKSRLPSSFFPTGRSQNQSVNAASQRDGTRKEHHYLNYKRQFGDWKPRRHLPDSSASKLCQRLRNRPAAIDSNRSICVNSVIPFCLLGLGITNGDTNKMPLVVVDGQGCEQNSTGFGHDFHRFFLNHLQVHELFDANTDLLNDSPHRFFTNRLAFVMGKQG